jgi:hypothetical protein
MDMSRVLSFLLSLSGTSDMVSTPPAITLSAAPDRIIPVSDLVHDPIIPVSDLVHDRIIPVSDLVHATFIRA